MPTNYGPQQRAVIAHIGATTKAKGIPPLDRGLRSIVAQQVRNLLVGGWPFAEIEDAAVSLALTYDRFNGHKIMTQLQARVERDQERRDESTHAERMEIERAATPYPVMALVRPDLVAREHAKTKHPNLHDYISDGRGSCSRCSGPIGVHVRRPLELAQSG